MYVINSEKLNSVNLPLKEKKQILSMMKLKLEIGMYLGHTMIINLKEREIALKLRFEDVYKGGKKKYSLCSIESITW